jgi:hypothetical protein
MWLEIVVRSPLVSEIREYSRDCGIEPVRICEEIIEQWCADRRLKKIKRGLPLAPRLKHAVEHDVLFN